MMNIGCRISRWKYGEYSVLVEALVVDHSHEQSPDRMMWRKNVRLLLFAGFAGFARFARFV